VKPQSITLGALCVAGIASFDEFLQIHENSALRMKGFATKLSDESRSGIEGCSALIEISSIPKRVDNRVIDVDAG
jgi:hypothetical protein